MFGAVHEYIFRYQLSIVFIRCHHISCDALATCLSSKRTDDIIRFIARYFQDRDAVGTNNIFYNRYGETDCFRGFFPLCFILFVGLMSEGRTCRVERHTNMGWIFFFEYFFKGIYKPQNSRSVETFGVNPWVLDKCVISAIYQCISIEKKQFIVRIHIFILFFMVKVQKNTVLSVLLLFLWENSDAWTTHHS